MSRGGRASASAAASRFVALASVVAAAWAGGCAGVRGGDAIRIDFDRPPWSDEAALRAVASHEIDVFVERRSEADLADVADTVARRLRADGFANARVDFELLPPEGGAAPAGSIHVTEGPRASIGVITFPGARAFRESELEKPFVPVRGPLQLSEAPLRQSRIDAAVSATETRYRVAGYANARVGPAVLRWNDDRTVADVEVRIAEGRRWTVSSVRVTGPVDEATARAIVAEVALESKPYDEVAVRGAANRARRLLANRGHLQAEAEQVVTEDPAAATVGVEIRVRPGTVVRTGDVAIEGLDRMRPAFARSLVPLESGRVLTQTDLDAAIDALQGTGVLESVEVTPVFRRPARAEPGAGSDVVADDGASGAARAAAAADEFADVAARVREMDARSVDLEVGWGSYELLRGRVRYLDRNFLGRASVLDAEVSASFRGAGTSVRWEDSRILGARNVLALQGEAHTREQPTFTEDEVGVEGSVRRDLGGGDTVAAGYRLSATRATGVSGSLAGAETIGFVRTGGVFARFERDRRDDRFFPREGSIVVGEVFWSSPAFGADLDFVELIVGGSRYFALGEKTVLVFAARATTREILDDRRTLPIQERVFLGGENSVRSFGQDELAPLNAAGDAAGGLSAAEAHVEVRRRITGSLDAAVFYDVGWTGAESFDLAGPPGQAIGTGLRYRLPVGPIRFDVAWNPGALYAADSRWAFHLSFGFAF